MGTKTVLSFSCMAGKKEFSAVVDIPKHISIAYRKFPV